MLNPNTSKILLESIEYKIYSKHLILNNVGLNGQRRLKYSKVLVIGAGGIGSPIIIYLSLAGIGLIGIVDADSVDISNLNRQILYNINDTNNKKCDSAENRINNIIPCCKVVKHPYRLIKSNALEIIPYYDIIIDATDNFETRYIIDEICYKLHKPYIYGAVSQFENQMSVFNYKDNIKYFDLYKRINNQLNNCNNDGIMGIVTGHIGILQASETIKIILGLNKIYNNKVTIHQLLNNNKKQVKLYPTRFTNNLIAKTNEIFIKQTNNLFYSYTNFTDINILIDIRDSYEFLNHHVQYAINIPFYKFRYKKTLIFLRKYYRYKNVYLYCSTSYKSSVVTNILRSLNIKYFILHYL